MSSNCILLDRCENVVRLADFHFDSLRKYMQPLYAMLVSNNEKSEEEKRLIRHQAGAEFLKRLRTYRGQSIEELAEQLNLGADELKRIEGGEVEISRGILKSYIEIYYGERELEHFNERLREFQAPSIRSARMALAYDALKRFGIIMDGVDYKALHTPRGKCLAFSRTNRTSPAESGDQGSK